MTYSSNIAVENYYDQTKRSERPIANVNSYLRQKNSAALVSGKFSKRSDEIAYNLEEKKSLNQVTMDLKSEISLFAMHLDDELRVSLLRQLNDMLEPEYWESEDDLPLLISWRTMLAGLIYLNPKQRPGLSLHKGHFLLSWTHESVRLTIECLSMKYVSWISSQSFENENLEVATGEVAVDRLKRVLEPYNQGHWLFNN